MRFERGVDEGDRAVNRCLGDSPRTHVEEPSKRTGRESVDSEGVARPNANYQHETTRKATMKC